MTPTFPSTVATLLLVAPLVVASDNAIAETVCGAISDMGDYDYGIHIGAIFIIFAASIFGSMLPVLSPYIPCFRNSHNGFSLLNSFGFGVVVSTAFIHMIPEGAEALNDPCLNVGYSGLAMAIVVLTVLVMQLLETELLLFWTKKAAKGDLSTDEENQVDNNSTEFGQTSTPAAHHHSHSVATNDKAATAMRKTINVLIFEVGVAIHSIFIGLNLGVATGKSFNTLLIAISFHQFFEGVAVGSSAVSAFTTLRSSVYTALGFSLATPFGMVVGIAINSTYSETSTAALWVRGTMDAVSGGILIYTSLVELLTYQYTTNQEFHDKSPTMRLLTYVCLWLGAASMAIVGYWA
ncbi:Aste57867_17251 [Aphanomyces stellatus]|uniref:Aste57867_17251 protein n=2 Tax=Aphanomyces stellatus TaxID=120398 RepID=A0A485L8P3_9STRA|nr:hypothetical protein As57867_017192 [Aphanomyces stellatus]VFT94007.1 Aste57867_17251 [Aphanomyces stellatus]